MVTIRCLSLKIESRHVGAIVRQSELESATVDTRVFAAVSCEVLEPGDAAENWALNSRRALRGALTLVEEYGGSGSAIVDEL